MKVNELLLLHGKYQTQLHFFVQFNFFMCRLSYRTFWTPTFLSDFPQLRLLAIAVHFWQSSAETVFHKAEIHTDLKFSSYPFLPIPSSFLAFHTLDIVVELYNSNIWILKTQKITQNINYSDLILWCCCSTYSIGLVLCSLSSLFYWPSWTSVDIFLLAALLLSAEIS